MIAQSQLTRHPDFQTRPTFSPRSALYCDSISQHADEMFNKSPTPLNLYRH